MGLLSVFMGICVLSTIFLSTKSHESQQVGVSWDLFRFIQSRRRLKTARLRSTDASLSSARQGSFGQQGTHSAEQDKSLWQIHDTPYFRWQLISSCHRSKIIIISYF